MKAAEFKGAGETLAAPAQAELALVELARTGTRQRKQPRARAERAEPSFARPGGGGGRRGEPNLRVGMRERMHTGRTRTLAIRSISGSACEVAEPPCHG